MPIFFKAAIKSLVLSAFMLVSVNVYAQDVNASLKSSLAEPLETMELLDGTMAYEIYTALESRQEKELLNFIDQGLYYKSSNLNSYNEELTLICKNLHYLPCPIAGFFTKKMVSAGIIYPSGTMVINEDFMAENTRADTLFILSHELAHKYFNHHKKYAKIFAQKIDEIKKVNSSTPNSIIKNMDYAPPELDSSDKEIPSEIISLIVMRPVMQEMESEADSFAFNYLVSQGLSFNCPAFFARFTNSPANQSVSAHPSPSKRCENYEKTLSAKP